MKRRAHFNAAAIALLGITSVALLAGCSQPMPNPTGSKTPSPTGSQSQSPSPTQTPTPTPSPTFTPGVDVIYIDTPVAGSTITQTELQVSGRASVFEGQFQYKLYRDGKRVQSGTVTASVGSPDLGDWSVAISGLTVGDYRFTAYDTSEKDGSTILKTSIEFLVRLSD